MITKGIKQIEAGGRRIKEFVSALLLLGALITSVVAQSPAISDELPVELRNIGIDEKLNTQVEPSLTFLDENGREVALGEYFKAGRPVVLNLVYYSCPMLCGMVLKGVTGSLKAVPYSPGQEIEVVTISFDPREKPELAQAKKKSVMEEYARPGAEQGWHFLTDKDDHARKLAGQIGFKYAWNAEENQFAHASVTMILTPEGKVSRYLYGIEYPPRDLRLALTEASQGKIGTLGDRFLLFCYHYDPAARSYVPFATNAMKVGGLLIMLLLGGALFIFWRRELRGQGGHAWPEDPKDLNV